MDAHLRIVSATCRDATTFAPEILATAQSPL